MKIVKGFFVVILVLLTALFTTGCYLARSGKKIGAYKQYETDDAALPGRGSVKVTFLGVTSLLLDDGKTQLLVDCFFSRPSLLKTAMFPLSTDTVVVNALLARYKIDRLQAVLISHSHYDHAFDAPYVATKTKALLVGSPSTVNIGKGGGLPNEQLAVFTPEREQVFGDFHVRVIASKHSPATPVNDDLGQPIAAPLAQPAKARRYVEGGTVDFAITHHGHVIYIKSSANYLPGKLNGLAADALFLSVGMLGQQDSTFQNQYYRETVGTLKPKRVIPTHWDNFFKPLSGTLELMPRPLDKTANSFDYLIGRTRADHIAFTVLQEGKSILLFHSH